MPHWDGDAKKLGGGNDHERIHAFSVITRAIRRRARKLVSGVEGHGERILLRAQGSSIRVRCERRALVRGSTYLQGLVALLPCGQDQVELPTRSVRAYDHTVSSVHLLSCSRLLKFLAQVSRA